MDKPLVSIVVRTHNRSVQLKKALQSLIDQTYKPIEVFVVDHNSTDNTREVVASFGGPVRYHRHTGCFRDTFNVWRDKVRGEFVSVLDDDDYIRPDCIEKLMQRFISREGIDIVFSRHRFFRASREMCTIEKETELVDYNHMKRLLLNGNFVPWNAVIFRKCCLDKIPKMDAAIAGGFDWLFWIQMAIAGCRFFQIDEVLGYIRRSPDSVQYQIERMSCGAVQCLSYYGSHLPLSKRLSWGYYSNYGYSLIHYGIICLEKGKFKNGRMLLFKGLVFYCFGLKALIKLFPATLILFFSVISDPKKARRRIEKLSGVYLFRRYHQKNVIP